MFVSEKDLAVSRHWQDSVDDLNLFTHVNLDKEMEEVDEFGRATDLKNSESFRRLRMEERSKRASQLFEAGELTIEEETQQQGEWTDDEFEEDERRSSRLNEIETIEIDSLLKDVGDEYRSLESVKAKFEAWKTTFNEDYKMAFGSLSLPGAFEFYIRLDLLTWNPFSVSVCKYSRCIKGLFLEDRTHLNLIVWNGIGYYRDMAYLQNMRIQTLKC